MRIPQTRNVKARLVLSVGIAQIKGDIERPSDCDGILYVSLDDKDGWKIQLLRELKAAGFGIDANQVL